MSFINKTLREISGMFASRKVAAMEILDEYLKYALKGSCITFCKDLAFDSAKSLDIAYKTEHSPIAALPFSLKDNICVSGILTTCNSKALKTHVPNSTAGIAKSLICNKAVLTAKNCMREFSVGRLDDCAFEIINHLIWCGTSKNVFIGAFSVGTDLGLPETQCGLWTLKPVGIMSDGIITGSPSLEKPTLNAINADDLSFLLPYFYNEPTPIVNNDIDPSNYSILVYNYLNSGGYVMDFLENLGFETTSSDLSVINGSDLLYETVLSTEFYANLQHIGKPNKEKYKWYDHEYIRTRTEGLGFDVKTIIIQGAYMMLNENISKTTDILSTKSELSNCIYSLLNTYDFIAAPVVYGDKMGKVSALTGLAELTVPFGDVLHFKLMTTPSKQHTLLDLAKYLQDKI